MQVLQRFLQNTLRTLLHAAAAHKPRVKAGTLWVTWVWAMDMGLGNMGNMGNLVNYLPSNLEVGNMFSLSSYMAMVQ